MDLNQPETAHRWLQDRIDRTIARSCETLLQDVAVLVSIATGDAVVIRKLSTDRRALPSVALTHTHPQFDDGLRAVISHADDWERQGGIWIPIIDDLTSMRWRAGEPVPPSASDHQREFLEHYPVTAWSGAPVVADGVSVGGLLLVRFASTKPQTADAEQLLAHAAPRIAALFALLDAATTTQALP